jgi:hypothetical protein
MFGRKSPIKTALLLDIENSSVGSALVRLAPNEAPQLWAQRRIATPVLDTRSALQLLREIEHAASEVLLHASEAAARARNHASVPLCVDTVIVFMAAPWGVPNLAAGRPDFSQGLIDTLTPRIEVLWGGAPITWRAHASAAVHGLRALYPEHGDALLFSVNGEVSELIRLADGHVVGHTTAPIGINTVLRTLKSHAGLSEPEARSALRLAMHPEQSRRGPIDALDTAAAHIALEFGQAVRELEQGGTTVFVLAGEPMAPWFAQALSRSKLTDLFPQGGVVRAIRSVHVAPFVSGVGGPDTHLALNALYVGGAHH